ncbi:MAG TPA: DUF1559 domain-containing protein [Gemmataceae bacterium]|jgi:hypothetical protein|nr:DUF1559 domain-containing protein [Gemmataceae bacterium]
MQKIIPVLVTLALALPAAAADRAEARARAIAPFLDEQTIAVFHVDLTRVDVAAILNKLPEVAGLKKSDLAKDAQEVRGRLTALTDAGVRDMYVVFTLADLPTRRPFMVMPLEGETDARAIEKAFGTGGFEKVGRAAVSAEPRTLERLHDLKPASFPDLARAFAAAGDTTAQGVVFLSADNRRVIEETLPTLPKEIGGGPSTVITHGFRWAAIGVKAPPKMSLHLVIQSRDAGSARDLARWINKNLKAFSAFPDVRQFLPHFDKIVAQLTPKVKDDRLTLSVDETILPLLRPAVVAVRQSSERIRSANDLKQIGLALHNYHDTHKAFPAAGIYSKDGKPLLSWRVQILPYIEQDALYKEFHLDEPWDSEHNKKLIARMPVIYRSSAKLAASGKTTYLGIRGEHAMFPGRKPVAFREVTDGTSNTIFVVDANDEHGVVWTKPEDLEYDPDQPLEGLVGHFPHGFNALFVDGSVHFIRDKIDPKALRALFTRDGGEVVDPNDY